MSAPTPIVNGTSGYYVQPEERGQDSTGPYRIVRYEGTRAQMKALELTIGLANYTYKSSPSGAKDSIEIRFAGTQGSTIDPGQTIWEIRYDKHELDIGRSTAALSLTALQAQQLRDYILLGTASAQDPTTTLGQLMALVRAGEKHVQRSVPTVSRTITFASQSAVTASQQNVDRIITTPSMYAVEGFPSDLVFSLPSNLDPINTDTGLIVHWGWLKFGPTVTRVAYSKTSISQLWQYGLWAQVEYGIPI